MKIDQDQIESIEPLGMLDGKVINLTRLKGGLNLATTSDNRVLGAASHQAILCYSIEKQFSNFQPMIMKSESAPKVEAESHSHFLTDDLRKSGHDIYSVQDGNKISFHVTKQNIKVAELNGSINGKSLVLSNLSKLPKEFVSGMVGATSEKMANGGLNQLKLV